MAIGRQLAERWPDRPGVKRDLSVGYDKLGRTYHALERTEEALHAYEASQAIAEELAAGRTEEADAARPLDEPVQERLAQVQAADGR